LVCSIVDVKRSAPNRVQHVINNLKKHHNVTVVCVNDWWKENNSTPTYDRSLDSIEVRYITEKKISPIVQESLSPTFIDLPNGRDFDAVFNYNTIISGYYLSNKYKIPMVYDLADDIPEMISTSPQVPAPFRKVCGTVGKLMMMESIKASEKVSCISNQLVDSYSVPRNKVLIAPNGVDTELFRPMDTNLKNELNLDFAFTLGYVGVLREWVDFSPIFEALKQDDELGMVVVGDEGSLKETVRNADDLGIGEQVHFSGSVRYSDVPKYISVMDACTIPFKKNPVTNNAVPVKLFEYLACGKQVISSDLLGVRETVGDRILYADTSNEISEHVSDMMTSGPAIVNQGNRSLVCERFSWKHTSQQIENILEEIA
jgi:glycosyltransferase involved in cell wall biosynthesis